MAHLPIARYYLVAELDCFWTSALTVYLEWCLVDDDQLIYSFARKRLLSHFMVKRARFVYRLFGFQKGQHCLNSNLAMESDACFQIFSQKRPSSLEKTYSMIRVCQVACQKMSAYSQATTI